MGVTRRPRRHRVTTLPQLISAAVERNPDGVALLFADSTGVLQQVTYAELDAWSNRLARWLIERDIGPEDLVAVAIPRSLDVILALWAVAKTGAGFVSMDPGHPPDWVEYLVADSGVKLGLGVSWAADSLTTHTEWLALDTASTAQLLEGYSTAPVTYADRVRPLRADHPAYVSYSSDVEDSPDAVLVSQTGIAGLCAELTERLQVDADARTLCFAAPRSDSVVLELLLALGGSAALVVAAPQVMPGEQLTALLRNASVTHAFLPPLIARGLDATALDELRVLLVGRQVASPDVVNHWAHTLSDGSNRQVVQAYGRSEATIVSTLGPPLAPGDPVTIGVPVRGVMAWVLDEKLRPVAGNVAGELYVAGAALAREYHQRPSLTAQLFVANPFADDGSRLLRTGDLVRRNPNGELQLIGAIEMLDDPEPSHNAMVLPLFTRPRPEPATPHYGPDARQTRRPSESAPRQEETSQQFAQVVPLPARNTTQQLDIVTPEAWASPASPSAPPRAEKSATTDFPNNVSRIPAPQFDDPAPETPRPRPKFDSPLTEMHFAGPELHTVVPPPSRISHGPRGDVEPAVGEEFTAELSPNQQYWWAATRQRPDCPNPMVVFAVRFIGDLDTAALSAALDEVVGRHELLHSIYPERAGQGYRAVVAPADRRADMVVETVPEQLLNSWLATLVSTDFRLTERIPLRASLAEVRPREHVLAVAVHRIAFDEGSVEPFLRDVLRAFTARRDDPRAMLPPLETDWTQYQRSHLAELGSLDEPSSLAGLSVAFWRTRLASVPGPVALNNGPLPAMPARAKVVRFDIAADVRDKLVDVARAAQASEFAVLHAVWAVLLVQTTGIDDSVIATWAPGRLTAEFTDLIGPVDNPLTLRIGVAWGETFTELVRRVEVADAGAFSYGQLDAAHVLGLGTGLQAPFTAALRLHTIPAAAQVSGVVVTSLPIDDSVLEGVLRLDIGEYPADAGESLGWSGALHYAEAACSAATAADLVEGFGALVRLLGTESQRPLSELLSAGVGALTPLPAPGRTSEPEHLQPELSRPDFPRPEFSWPEPGSEPQDFARSAGELLTTATAQRLREVPTPGVEIRAVVIDLPPECDAGQLEAAVRAVLARHPLLWASWDRARVRIPQPSEKPERLFWWLDPGDRSAALPIDDVVQVAAEAIDPQIGRSIHFVVTGAAQSFQLVVVANALVVDDPSWRVLIDQLIESWQPGRSAASGWPDPRGAALLRDLDTYRESPEFTAQIDWWRHILADEPQPPPMPSGSESNRRRVSLTITADGTEAVSAVADSYGTGVQEVLLAAVALALHTAAGERVPRLVGSLVRLDADPRRAFGEDNQGVVGGFCTDYPLPLRIAGVDTEDVLFGGPAAGVVLHHVVRLLRSVPMHGIGYGLLRWVDPHTSNELAGLPDGRFAVRYQELRPGWVHTDPAAAGVALTLTVQPTDHGLLARFDYSADVFTGTDVKVFAEHWVRALGGLAEHGLRLRDAPEPQAQVSETAPAPESATNGSALLAHYRRFDDPEPTAYLPPVPKNTSSHSPPPSTREEPTRPGGLSPESEPLDDPALAVVLPIRTRVPHGTEPTTPLFCVHPLVGLAWGYSGISEHLPPDCPIYGLQSPCLTEADNLPDSLAGLAHRYVSEIRRVQPEGPYRLLGWSFGGVVAHAMAVELQHGDQEVSVLAMLNSPIGPIGALSDIVRRGLREIGIAVPPELDDDRIADLRPEDLTLLYEVIAPDVAALTADRLRRIYHCTVRAARCLAGHLPGVFRGRLDYFSAAGEGVPAEEWVDHVDGTIVEYPVDADHSRMTSPESLAEIGPVVAELLAGPVRALGR